MRGLARRGSTWRDVDRARLAVAILLIGAVFSFGLGQALGHMRPASSARVRTPIARAHPAGAAASLHVDLQAAAPSMTHTGPAVRALPNAAPAPRASHPASHGDSDHHGDGHDGDGHHGAKHHDGHDHGGDAGNQGPKAGGDTGTDGGNAGISLSAE